MLKGVSEGGSIMIRVAPSGCSKPNEDFFSLK